MSERRRGRAVSDVVAFTLMFGIILTSVGLVATFGLAELNSFNEHQKIENADRTFELIARSFDELEESQATVRTEAIELGGSSITVEESSSLTVTVRDTDTGTTHTESFPLNTLQYEVDNRLIGYENGATYRVRTNADGGIINRDPGLVCSDGQAVLSLVTIRAEEDRYISGSGTLRITGRLNDSSLLYPVSDTDVGNASAADQVDLQFTFSGESRAREWANHFDRAPGDWSVTSQTDTSVTVRCGASEDLDHVYVRRSIIEVSYS
ncbi:DUF7289 family protein [Halapricum salinum]|uniref:Uncharacterized protein n=1 Tax=Halapricum salinum TaxID=1457250 RepID=A0A4D6H840_9EURY|nr:hypothetical protein [Halapricum salinum]QCC50003.1 hypothetical protein DV733_01655 [Halapricum salinum]